MLGLRGVGLNPIGMKVFGEAELSPFFVDVLGCLRRVLGDYGDFGEAGSAPRVTYLAKLTPPKLLYVPVMSLFSTED